MGFLDTIRSKYELYRLEQRYTRRETRTTFKSGAVYVDGEYIYQNGPPPLSPGEGPGDESPWKPQRTTGNASSVSSPASSGPSSPLGGNGREKEAPWGRMPER